MHSRSRFVAWRSRIPNPMVGAVIVKNGRVIGEGFHVYDRFDHAEIVALKQAGENARGATLYVTLEPCCTTGRTGPCTKAIIAAGVKRVVRRDARSKPRSSRSRIRAAPPRGNSSDDVGTRREFARTLNEDFAKWIRTGLPFVTLKTALTLDGQIAQRPGSATPITGRRVARLLCSVCAMQPTHCSLASAPYSLMIPCSPDRTGEPRRRTLLRVVAGFAASPAVEIEAGEVGKGRRACLHHAADGFAESARTRESRRRNFSACQHDAGVWICTRYFANSGNEKF